MAAPTPGHAGPHALAYAPVQASSAYRALFGAEDGTVPATFQVGTPGACTAWVQLQVTLGAALSTPVPVTVQRSGCVCQALLPQSK